jgi:cytoskeletal protein RodZ
MKKNQKGFSAVEGLLILIIVGLIGFVGWYVWHANEKTNENLAAAITSSNSKATIVKKVNDANKVNKEEPTNTGQPSTTKFSLYTFKELGISMNVLDGWNVKSSTTKQGDATLYTWTVEKTGADGKINLTSTAFQGGFEGCEMAGELTPATIKEVMPTHNDNLMFISWSYVYSNESNSRITIARTDETVFRTTSNTSANAIKNKDVKAGKYFFCLSEPSPGFSLKLNKSAPPEHSARIDSIRAVSSSSIESKYIQLSSNAGSYPDIKAMLTSIK